MEEKNLEVNDAGGVSEDNSKKSGDETKSKDITNEETDRAKQDNNKKIEDNEVKKKEPEKEEIKKEETKSKESNKVEKEPDKKENMPQTKEDGTEKEVDKAEDNEAKKEPDKKAEEVKADELKEATNNNLESVAQSETTGKEDVENKKRKSKTIKIYAASIVGLGLAVVYFGGVHYFKKRFLPNTTINYTDASYETIDALDEELQKPISNYSLEIIAREGEKHVIRAKDVDLRYKLDKSIYSILENQEVYKWPIYLFKKNPHKVAVTVDLDNAKLEYILSGYNCLTEASFKEARDAYIASYSNASGYVIEKEYDGTRIDIDKAKAKIKSSLTQLGLTEDLDADGLYGFAKIKEDDAKLLSAQDVLNKHAATVISYAGGAVLNGERISQWLGVDEEGNLILDEGGIRVFVDELAERYDTLGKPRIFKTTDSREVEIPAKKYGWQVDKEGEFQAIRASILAGEQVEREPLFSSRAVSLEGNDFGNTYVEIDLGNQKLYYYVDGQLTLTSDIVSGALWGGRKTPPGLYKVNYKARNVVLRGPNYAAPVRYWMPFNGGIGMHDANWRSSFGGGIYKSGGSHGCINMPSSSAKALYDIINKDCPVICYY
jgi:erfK/ybiS/ycfS/ynhG family protein